MAGEFDLIKRYLAAPVSCSRQRKDGYPNDYPASSGVTLGPGDDATLLTVSPGCQLAISVDTSVVDVHFPADAPPHAVGHRALAASLSDLAAMGARPRWYLSALTLPEASEEWLAEMSRGMHELAQRCGVVLVGGDTTRGTLALSMTVHGEVNPGRAIRRDGARRGDVIAVVGTLGGAAGGLREWQQGRKAVSALLNAYLYPQPLLAEGQALAGIASAGIDISDGLLADLQHLCRASGVGAELALDALPLHPELTKVYGEQTALQMALRGSDDYALLLTLPEQAVSAAQQALSALGQTLHLIGQITEGDALTTLHGDTLMVQGWQHF